MSFTPRLSTAGQVAAVEHRGWDPIQKQSFSGRAERSGSSKEALSSSGKTQISTGAGGQSEINWDSRNGSATALEAKAAADGMLAEQNRRMVSGSGTCAGDTRIRAGVEVTVERIGRFSGLYVVDEATHSVGAAGFQTSFEVSKP
jgi:hypothetical protein